MQALPGEILSNIGVYLMPEPLRIHMLLPSDRLDFNVCGESMESDSPNTVLLAKKRYVKDLHSFGKTFRAAKDIRDFIFRQRLTVYFFNMNTTTHVLETQNLQPFRSIVVAFKHVNESILPSLCQLSKFSQLARLQVYFLVSHTMERPRRQEFKQQVKQQLLSPTIELDIKLTVHLTVHKLEPQHRPFFRTAHWFNPQCRKYYDPVKVQVGMWSRTASSVEDSTAIAALRVEDILAMVAP